MPNQLARETSPYLLQHADNPVDWLPWGEEALARATREDRPVMLSVGYSACHWCHVMERESFSDEGLAELLNRNFVSVKVDREERPDVDALYMRAVQALTGSGGWPLTVFLTPDGRPFYGGTYFPPEPRHGMPSFRQVLEATLQAWAERRDEIDGAASEITDMLERMNRRAGGRPGRDSPPLDRDLPERAAAGILAGFDAAHGGFGGAPKFPQPLVLEFLVALHAGGPEGRATGGPAPEARAEPPPEARAEPVPGVRAEPAPRAHPEPAPGSPLAAAVHTLRSMARGGIRDHLGGGFHRYSVDARWLVPHFEKMLYDNALLASAYLRGYQATGDDELAAVARETLDYLLDDLRSPEGAFYAARDADSEGEEGRYYLWTSEEVDALLDSEAAALFRRCYDVSESGNFEGRNILHLPHDLDVVARGEGISDDRLEERLAEARSVLLEARSKREAPLRDSKILAAWNGLALRTLADAGAALGERRYVDAAGRGLGFLLGALRRGDRLLHQVPGPAGREIPAFLDDVASLGNACLSLHEATLERKWLDAARELAAEVEARFRDPESGLLFDTPADGEGLVVRPREVMDSAVPAGSSLGAELSLRLGRLLGETALEARARELVETVREELVRMPSAFGLLLRVARDLVHPPVEVALAGDDEPALETLLAAAHAPFLPGRVITGRRPGEELELPLLEGRTAPSGGAAAWVCRNHACRAPVHTPDELEVALREALGPAA